MPGILPMKVIKVGTSAQTRIAQACDRCRSKKIRCDGFRPCCSQCANVGFECKTSDKLSRRAFPRGYTESLEERVRALEAEVKELKDLLDAKDEKIDMLSKVHSHSTRTPISPRTTSPASCPSASRKHSDASLTNKDDLFKVQQSPFLLDGQGSDGYFVGTSSVHALIDSFKLKLQQSGRSCPTVNADSFFPAGPKVTRYPSTHLSHTQINKPPPRMLSDQMVNIFFQEWAPLFPVIHRPAFLSLYEEYVSNPESVTDMKCLAQLNLVFGIAALSSESRISYDTKDCERQWVMALNSFMMETSLVNVQCLNLAQIYCLQKGDYDMLLHYKGLAVSIAQRLGLHLSQKRFALGTLASETRKKVFWTLYTIDCFSAACLGVPKLIRDEDVHCEYPVDADDEYISDKGFQPSLPGEYTKISSALALFRGSRILSKVLEQVYPSSASHELSFSGISALDEELEAWSSNLPSHLKLEFQQDKPSTNIISSRCPLLSLTYNYIKCILHRPAACANLGDRSSSSLVSMSQASKRIIQIVQLLDQRNLSFSHCINKNEILTSSGFTLLYQILDLEKTGKLMQDSQRMVCVVIDMIDRLKAPGCADFRKVACALLSVGRNSNNSSRSSPRSGGSGSSSVQDTPELAQKQLPGAPSRHIILNQDQVNENRSATAPVSTSPTQSLSPKIETATGSSAPPSISHQLHRQDSVEDDGMSPLTNSNSRFDEPRCSSSASATTNLDFFQFPDDPAPQPANQDNNFHDSKFWEKLISNLSDGSFTSEDEAEWTHMNHLITPPVTLGSNNKAGEATVSPEVWNLGGDFVDLGQDSSLGVMMHNNYTPESFTPDDGRSIDQIDQQSLHKQKT